MKKLLFSLAVAASAVVANAVVKTPADLKPDFSTFSFPDGWSSRGIDDQFPNSFSYKKYFKNYSADNAFTILSLGTDYIAFTPNVFSSGVESDQWLISEEFEISYDDAVICVTAMLYDSGKEANYSILLSEGGTNPEDFTTELASGEIKATSNSNPVKEVTKRVVVSGMKGKKVRLAMVGKGKSGMIGFYNIQSAAYYISINDSQTLSLIKAAPEEDIEFQMTANVVLPVDADGLTAVLETSGGQKIETTNTKKFRAGKIGNVSIKFDGFKIEGGMETYTVYITPNYEGAPSTEVSGKIVNCDYESVVLFEEATSTGCGYCPYGFALLNYYQDKYNTGDRQRVIGAAYHGLFGKEDPMYVQNLFSQFETFGVPRGFAGYPWMLINRKSGEHPADVDVDKLLEQKTFGDVRIKSCSYDEATNMVTVCYDAKLGYTAVDGGVNAVALITENNMSGTTSVWSQSNYLNTKSEVDIASMFGEDAVPYFSLFVGPEALGNVPASKMVYDDVARECYPSFLGEQVQGAWEKDQTRQFEMVFELPNTVTNWKEADVVIILTHSESEEMVTADRMKLTPSTSVESLGGAESLSVASRGSEIIVNAPEAGNVALYSADGRQLGRYAIEEGSNTIDASQFNGVVIVRAIAGKQTRSVKIVIR